jgi:hypothetical protein
MECPDDKILNPYTNKCVKKCKSPEQERNLKFNCVKPCKSGQYRNEKTGRCKNIDSKKNIAPPPIHSRKELSSGKYYIKGMSSMGSSEINDNGYYKDIHYPYSDDANVLKIVKPPPPPPPAPLSLFQKITKTLGYPNKSKSKDSSVKRPIKSQKTLIQKTIKSIKKTLGYRSSSGPSKFSFTNRISKSKSKSKSKSIYSSISPKNYDAFDENKFKDEYDIFAIYFTGIEKLIRIFEWIKYNHGYNFKPQDRTKLIEELHNQGSYENKKKYLETLTDIGDPFEFLSAWYNHYDPSKNNSKHINHLLNNYSGCFGVLYNKLYKKYVNPNWEAVDLWIDDESCKDR